MCNCLKQNITILPAALYANQIIPRSVNFLCRRSRRCLWPDFNGLPTNKVLVVQIQGPRRAPRTPGWTFPFRLIDFSFFSFVFWSHQCEPSSLTGPDMVFKEENQWWKTRFFSLWQRLISITIWWWLEGAYCHCIHSEFLFLRVFSWNGWNVSGWSSSHLDLWRLKTFYMHQQKWVRAGDKHPATENLILAHPAGMHHPIHSSSETQIRGGWPDWRRSRTTWMRQQSSRGHVRGGLEFRTRELSVQNPGLGSRPEL